MTLPAVKKILMRAATDAEFRSRLMSQSDSVFSRYDLTDEEKQCLRGLNEDQIATEVQRIDEDNHIRATDIRI